MVDKRVMIAIVVVGMFVALVWATGFSHVAPAVGAQPAAPINPPNVSFIPQKARPAHNPITVGRVRNILSRKDTFGFSVRTQDSTEVGFYVENKDMNQTMIDTVLFAAQTNRPVRVYSDNTSVVDAIETWSE